MSILNLLPFMITFLGAYFLVKLRFFFIVHPIKTLKKIGNIVKDGSSRKSLALALAGTLGVGNIVGVAYGISVGGPGSLFWIFISGIFASVIKYAESTLAADKLCNGRGGMMYAVKSSFSRIGAPLGAAYAFLCLMLSLSMGSSLQSQSAVNAVNHTLKINPVILSVFFALLVAAVIRGGAKKIENATAIIIPLSTVVYIIICLSVVFHNVERIPSVLSSVMADAFNFESASGGVSAFLASKAMKEGYARGLLSNEAGAGTSSMAQTRSKNFAPSDIGLLGACEVFFDTSLLCMLTGFAVLVSGVDTFGVKSGMAIVSEAVCKSLGGGAEAVLFLLVTAFAYSTVVCWYYYGCECIKYLFKKEKSLIFGSLFVLSAFIGFTLPSSLLITVTDYVLFLMSVITLLALIKNSERVVRLSEQNGLLKKSDIGKKLVPR